MMAADSPIEPSGERPLDDAFLEWEAPERDAERGFASGDPATANGESGPAESAAALELPTVACSRCRKRYAESAPRCPYCRARNPAAEPGAHVAGRSDETAYSALKVVLILFCAQLMMAGAYQAVLAQGGNLANDARTFLATVTGIEIIDSVLVAVAFGLTRRVPLPSDATHPGLAWGLSLPLLGAVLAANFGYHALLRWVGFLTMDMPLDLKDPVLAAWSLAAICIQPALIEEWFFRGIAFKTLRSVLTPHQTVWIVAVMFGMAHTGAVISIPMLCLVGAFFGYARLYSGGLLLPMVLHFTHNFAVLVLEQGI